MCLGKRRNSGNAQKTTFLSSGDVPLILSYISSCLRDYRFPTHQNQLLNSYHRLFLMLVLAPGLNCVQRFLKFGTSTFAHEAILRNHFSSYLIKIKLNVYLLQSQVSPRMTCEAALLFERFITFVALKWFFPSVLLLVFLQSARSSASIVALVTFERLLSCVHRHHVNFQFASLNARILACCTSVWLFTRVHPLVLLQVS